MWVRDWAYRAELAKFDVLLGGSIGLAFFLIAFGVHIIQPEQIAWLLENHNHDSIQHFVGWEFFRYEAWHFPLGMITRYGDPIPTSVVYTDSIPLFALLFKCFAEYLPENFQYFGLWFALCFFLQGIFAWALSSYMTESIAVKCCVTLFFLLSPIMLNRLIEHQALVAHWMILAGFLLYLRPYQNHVHGFWFLLNTLAILIHAYLAAMVFALWLAFLARVIFIDHRLSFVRSLGLIVANLFCMIVAAWISGYFVISIWNLQDPGGYSTESFNLFAPFMPGWGSVVAGGGWSRFIPPFTSRFLGQGVEGFNYLGAGMLMLLALSLYFLFTKPPRKKIFITWSPVIALCAILTLYAVSNVFYAGQHVLFSYHLPKHMMVTQLFRSSGRFFWPVYYGLMIAVFFILNRSIKNQILVPLLGFALVLQFADLSIKISELHQRFFLTRLSEPLPLLEHIGNQYKRIAFLPFTNKPERKIDHFGDYIYYAATHHMSVNLGYFARQDSGAFLKLNQALLAQIFHGEVSPDTVYVITNPHFTRLLAHRTAEKATAIPVGRYVMLLPRG